MTTQLKTHGEASESFAFEPLLTLDELKELFRLSGRSIDRLCKRGRLPQPLKVGGSNRWLPNEIQDALEAFCAVRGQKPRANFPVHGT